jgi:hypothetical protein
MRLIAWGLVWSLAGGLALSGAAAGQGHWRGGGFVGAVPHGYYHPPPPPPVADEGCYAGAYVCPLDRPAVVGEPCACPTAQGMAWGRAR